VAFVLCFLPTDAAPATAPVSASMPTVAQDGFDDLALYQKAAPLLVGAQPILSFSSASAAGPNGSVVDGHGLPAPEALCNCACWGLDNFAYCQNTAKTTVGVSTYFLDGTVWRARGLRYFAAGSEGWRAGRIRTSFHEVARLPDGPGGQMLFDVSYLNDQESNVSLSSDEPRARSAEVVRGRTGPVACSAAPLCNVQCAGVPQYDSWFQRCAHPE
jgi:hypothetical protein